MAKPKSEKTTTDPQLIDPLQQRHQALNTKKIQAETQLETASENLRTLKERALKEYGTDKIEQLQQQLEAMVQENERKRTEYLAHLDGIEKALAAVETKFSTPEETSTPKVQ